MVCRTCSDLLATYRHAVSLYTAATRDIPALVGDELRLASREVEHLRRACREADDALMAHRREYHPNLVKT